MVRLSIVDEGKRRAWRRNLHGPFGEKLEVDFLRVRVVSDRGTPTMDVIAGPSGRERWGWKTVSDQAGDDEIQTSGDIDSEPDPTDPTDPTVAPPSQRVPPRGGSWDSGAATEDDMDDPTPGEPVTVEEEAFPGFDPLKRYFWNGSDWEVMKPDGGPDGDGCYYDHKADKVCYDWTSHPGSRPPDIGKHGGVDPNVPVTNGDPPEDCPDPTQRRNSSGECVDKPACTEDRRGILRVRDKTTGKCVRDPDTTKNGKCDDQPGTVWDEASGQCIYPPRPPTPGDPGPGYRTYGMDPNDPDQPWDVDLSYLRDAPPFEFEYDPWVEPEAFAYAPYDKPDPFSYPEFAPPTGQQVLDEDPGYQFRREEGRKALERAIAARGTLLTGATKKGLSDYVSDYASQEYEKSFNRRLQQYREGSGMAERAYDRNLRSGQWAHQTNLGAAQDQWAANRQAQFQGYGANRRDAYQIARDQYSPGLASWSAEQRARERAEFAKYGRQWQAYTYGQPSASTIFGAGAGYSTRQG